MSVELKSLHREAHATVDNSKAVDVAVSMASNQGWFGFKIVGDNIDKNVRPRHQTIDSQTKSLHYFHAFAALDRIDLSLHSEKRPSIDPSLFDLESLLPSSDDICKMKSNFQFHIARVITTFLHCLTPMKAVVPLHIQHQYHREMSRKSTVVRGHIYNIQSYYYTIHIDLLHHNFQRVYDSTALECACVCINAGTPWCTTEE